MAQLNLEIVLYYFRIQLRQGAQVNPRIVLPKSNWDSPACGQRNPVCAYLAWKTVLSFATSSSTSLPCTIAASSSVSAVECGQNRQCIPISVKIFTTASIAASEQERSTSPTVISLLIMRGTSFPGARLGAPLFYDTPERRICQPFRQENHSISTGRSESLNGFSPSYASSCTFLFRATGALVTDCM